MSTVYCNGTNIELRLEYLRKGFWIPAENPCSVQEKGLAVRLDLKPEGEDCMAYSLSVESEEPTQVRLSAALSAASEDEDRVFHVIPCCIYGDNNAREVHAGEFPLLCNDPDKGDVFRAPRWEFRADRAAMPLSAVCTKEGVLAVTVEPYSEAEHVICETAKTAAEEQKEGSLLHNGLFSELPGYCGISLGYTNDPISFINKRTPGSPTRELACRAETSGRIYYVKAQDNTEKGETEACGAKGLRKPARAESPRLALHRIVRREYALRHTRPVYRKSFREAVEGCMESFLTISWNPASQEYTNCNCLPPESPKLHPWRNVKEIGWTGGGVLAYPMVLGEEILGDRRRKETGARSGREMLDQIAGAYNEASGLLYDLTSPIDTDTVTDAHNESSGLASVHVAAAGERARHVNGWWAQFGLAKDVHCAYTVGSAVHYLLKTTDFLTSKGEPCPKLWLESARKTLDTVIELQREDGAFGYTYYVDHKGVADWNGFAGCWFVPCAAYLYHLTGEERYLAAADRGLSYYQQFVVSLCCNGTPMDTWKSPDEEGNLAFIRGARLLHEYTGEEKYLTALRQGAEYEFLWRYGYQTKPENYPIREGWNACGGSVTSVSNPHIHPMGMIVDSDLYYLGRVTGDSYYTDRALDGTAWIMQTLELYPEKTGYGRYGVLSERWCPSDGLVIQKDSNGNSYSSWFSYNLWAGAAAFEEVCERCLEEQGRNDG